VDCFPRRQGESTLNVVGNFVDNRACNEPKVYQCTDDAVAIPYSSRNQDIIISIRNIHTIVLLKPVLLFKSRSLLSTSHARTVKQRHKDDVNNRQSKVRHHDVARCGIPHNGLPWFSTHSINKFVCFFLFHHLFIISLSPPPRRFNIRHLLGYQETPRSDTKNGIDILQGMQRRIAFRVPNHIIGLWFWRW
jgi:hypothetical protein